MKRRYWQRQSGQAIAEVVIGLVGIVVVFLGLLQMATTGNRSIENLLAARAQAEVNASTGNLLSSQTRYVADWRDGNDGLRHTADDLPLSVLFDDLLPYDVPLRAPIPLDSLAADPAIQLRDLVARAAMSDSLAVAADMYGGTSTQRVAIEPALQYFLFNRVRQLNLQDDVVMPGLTLQP